MKRAMIAFAILAAFSSAASYASNWMLLHVGQPDGSNGGGGGSACTGVVDLSLGCPQPMLGI